MTNLTCLDEYSSFFFIYKLFERYAIDMTIAEKNELRFPRPFELSEEEYFQNLSIKRDQEETITNFLFYMPNMVLLIGEKGSGKTSTGRNALRQFKFETQNQRLVFILDLRTAQFSKSLSSLTPNEMDAEVLEKIKDYYLTKIFPLQETFILDGQIHINRSDAIIPPLIRLLAFLIDPNICKPTQFDFGALCITPQVEYEKFLSVPGRPLQSYAEWLNYLRKKDTGMFEKIANSFVQSKKLQIFHLMYAANQIYSIERQCIWLDNVDSLALEQEISVQSAVKRLSSSINQIGNVILSVRDKNVFIEYEFDEFQAPPFPVNVQLHTENKDVVPALQIERISLNKVKEIIESRLKFTRDKVNEVVRSSKEGGMYLVDPDRSSLKDSSINRFKLSSIQDETYENIRYISNRLFEVWNNVDGPAFANNSIRLLLDHHCDFLKYFFYSIFRRKIASNDDNPKDDISRSIHTRGLATEYLAWIRKSQIQNDVASFYDIVFDLDTWINSDGVGIGCTLEHLIITSTWNLTIEQPSSNPNLYHIPRVGSVIEKLIGLGYTKDKVRKVMFSLYHEETVRTHFIEIQSTEMKIIVSPEDIKEDYLIRVTPRGKSLSRSIINTFGYMVESVINYLKCTNQKIPEGLLNIDYYSIQEESAIDLVCPYLEDISEMHIKSLENIHKVFLPYKKKNWIDIYLQDFGIPLRIDTQPEQLGHFIGHDRRAFQFEMIINGMLKYVQKDYCKEKLGKIEQSFYSIIEELRKT